MLAIIPARKGSRGVPGKALRTIGGRPLILRTLETVSSSLVAERIVVTTDCPEVASFCRLRGHEVIDRPSELGGDDVPLMDVARHAVHALEWEGTVGIFQPTCPLLTSATVRNVVAEFSDRGLDWAITASDDPHIHWKDGALVTDRAQRQNLAGMVKESGAVQLFTTGNSPRTTGTITIPQREALDIDTPEDMMLAERLSSIRNIHFVVLMGERVGTGHFHRSFALARALSHHNISWEWRGEPADWATERIDYPEAPADGPVEVLIFDCLRPGQSEVLEARSNGVKVIALEDESGDDAADLTVNDMLDPKHLQYAVLRSEFLCLPEHELRDGATSVLLTFGGTDPARLTGRCMNVMKGYEFDAADAMDAPLICTPAPAVGADIWCVPPNGNARMAELMREADLVVTSQGRTVLEAAACGTPCISIAANERENRHVRIPGITYLGLHSTATDDQIRHAVRTTLADRHLREENAHAAREAVDGKGLDRLVRLIEGVIAE